MPDEHSTHQAGLPVLLDSRTSSVSVPPDHQPEDCLMSKCDTTGCTGKTDGDSPLCKRHNEIAQTPRQVSLAEMRASLAVTRTFPEFLTADGPAALQEVYYWLDDVGNGTSRIAWYGQCRAMGKTHAAAMLDTFRHYSIDLSEGFKARYERWIDSRTTAPAVTKPPAGKKL